MPTTPDALRTHVLNALDSADAHVRLDDALDHFPEALRGVRPEGLPYSGWELLEHVRRTQADILDFCRNPDYAAPDWPADYWPPEAAPPTDEDWHASIDQLRADREALGHVVRSADDLLAEIPHSDGQTYLREALLAADHAAYHLGQLVVVRRLLGTWPPA